MIKLNDIEKAIGNIDQIFVLRDLLNNATPDLNEIKSNLSWYQKLCNIIPENSTKILSSLETTINSTFTLNPNNLNYSSITGVSGSLHAVSSETKAIIQSYGSKYYNLIDEYNEINKTENLIESILKNLLKVRDDLQIQSKSLYQTLDDAKVTYGQWKAEMKSNSDLAKDIRTFQDLFKGFLHKARVKSHNPPLKKNPEESWLKMADALVKKGSGYLNLLKNQQSEHVRLHKEFTVIMKKTKEVEKEEMEKNFKDYIEHVYAVINLIDEKLIN